MKGHSRARFHVVPRALFSLRHGDAADSVPSHRMRRHGELDAAIGTRPPDPSRKGLSIQRQQPVRHLAFWWRHSRRRQHTVTVEDDLGALSPGTTSFTPRESSVRGGARPQYSMPSQRHPQI